MSNQKEAVRTAVLDELRQIAPEADIEALAPQADIRRTLEIDSFDFLRLLIGLNQRLAVEIPEKDYGKLSSLQNLVDYLADRLDSSKRA